MKNLLIIILSFFGTLALANVDKELLNAKEKTIEKIRYYENKLFKSADPDLSLRNIRWNEAFKVKEANLFDRQYVSYDLNQPASPFVILVVPFQKIKFNNNRNESNVKLKN